MKYGVVGLFVMTVAAIVVNVPNAGYVVLALVVVGAMSWTLIRLNREQRS
jgi:hypothetical protein